MQFGEVFGSDVFGGSVKRLALTKRVRFEVFKRDSFTCQYCGAKAPEVVLCVDHIEPVAKGGSNEILNLVTSCEGCNSGKGAVRLSDESAIEKARKQAELLQGRREQIEMIAAWHRELSEQDNYAAEQVAGFIPGPWAPNEHGNTQLGKWLKKFGLSEIIESTQIAFSTYFKDDQATWERAFNMIPRIAHVRELRKTDPSLAEAHRLRGILAYKLSYLNHSAALDILAALIDEGDLSEAENLCRNARSWTRFQEAAYARLKQVRSKKQV